MGNHGVKTSLVCGAHEEAATRRGYKYYRIPGIAVTARGTLLVVCEARGGRVMLNGRVAKAGAEVKPGDVIELSFGQRSLRVEVVSVSESAAKADAPAMYRELA